MAHDTAGTWHQNTHYKVFHFCSAFMSSVHSSFYKNYQICIKVRKAIIYHRQAPTPKQVSLFELHKPAEYSVCYHLYAEEANLS